MGFEMEGWRFQKKYSRELKPLDKSDVERMMEEDIQFKFCEMGNACYLKRDYQFFYTYDKESLEN